MASNYKIANTLYIALFVYLNDVARVIIFSHTCSSDPFTANRTDQLKLTLITWPWGRFPSDYPFIASISSRTAVFEQSHPLCDLCLDSVHHEAHAQGTISKDHLVPHFSIKPRPKQSCWLHLGPSFLAHSIDSTSPWIEGSSVQCHNNLPLLSILWSMHGI